MRLDFAAWKTRNGCSRLHLPRRKMQLIAAIRAAMWSEWSLEALPVAGFGSSIMHGCMMHAV